MPTMARAAVVSNVAASTQLKDAPTRGGSKPPASVCRRASTNVGARWHSIRNRSKRKPVPVAAVATESGFEVQDGDRNEDTVTHHNDGHDGEPYYYAFKELHKEHSASDLIELNAGALHVDAFASDLSLHNYDAPFPDDVAFPQSAFPRRKGEAQQEHGEQQLEPPPPQPAAAARSAWPATPPPPAPSSPLPSPAPEFARVGPAVPLPWWRLTAVDRQMLGQVATCAAAAIAEPLLGMVDTVCIGHLGLLPLAAMAPNNTIFGMINQLATFTLVVTVANKVAIALGAGAKGSKQLGLMSAAEALNVGNACALALGLAVAAAFCLCPDPFLNWFGAYPDTLQLAREYFQVRAVGAPAALLTMSLQGAYSAALDLRTPLIAVVGSGLLNASLDMLLIFGLGWGMAGAAAATVAAQYAACALLLHRAYAVDRKLFALPPLPPGAQWWREGDFFTLAQPAAAYRCFLRMCGVQTMRAVNVILAWTLCNVAASRMGLVQAASHQLVFQFQMFQVLAMQAFATVGNSVTARAFQGGGMRAARRVADRLLVFGLLASSTLASSTWLMRGVLPTLFTSDAACHLACQPAMLPVCVMLALTWFKVPEGALLGVGDGRYLAMCYVPAAAVTVLQLLHTHVRGLGLCGVWCALAMYYATLALLFCIRWYGGGFVSKRKEATAPAAVEAASG